MAFATILIEDVGSEIGLRCDYGTGFDPQSHAHQHANLLIAMMDQLAARNLESVKVIAEDKQ